jgi:hypothetical protein
MVASQEIEGEAILIHFDTGCYYSVNATGVCLLGLIHAGTPAEELGRELAARFETDPDEGARAAGMFVGELLREGLLVAGSPAEPWEIPGVFGKRVAFVEPALQRFDDLQDLLMLDPIHDVDQTGWPLPRREDQAPSPG